MDCRVSGAAAGGSHGCRGLAVEDIERQVELGIPGKGRRVCEVIRAGSRGAAGVIVDLRLDQVAVGVEGLVGGRRGVRYHGFSVLTMVPTYGVPEDTYVQVKFFCSRVVPVLSIS